VCPPRSIIKAGIDRVKRLVSEQHFGANQVLLVAVDIEKPEVMQAAIKARLDVVDVSGVFRFPLPPTDLRVAFGTPDDVQGLEAEVVVVLLSMAALTIAAVRDLYVAASRARSHLVIVSQRPLGQLQLAARAVLAQSTDAS
jgi:hypothetical protein